MWLRNPFPILRLNESIDLQISTDEFNGDQWSRSNRINTGFYMIRSNKKTVALFDEWYSRKDNSTGMKEQDVLIKLMNEGVFTNLGLAVRFLDTLYFSGFCEDSKDVRRVTTFHANCCRSIRAKMADLTVVIHDWKRFKILSANETSTFRWSSHTACRNSWKQWWDISLFVPLISFEKMIFVRIVFSSMSYSYLMYWLYLWECTSNQYTQNEKRGWWNWLM